MSESIEHPISGERLEIPTKALRYKEYTRNDSVVMVRPDGTVETGWQFSHQRLDNGYIGVRKPDGRKWIEEEIPADEFDAMQQGSMEMVQ